MSRPSEGVDPAERSRILAEQRQARERREPYYDPSLRLPGDLEWVDRPSPSKRDAERGGRAS